MTKNVLFVFGTRPEAIKLAPLIHKLKEVKKFRLKICITAQHREMLDQVLEIFNIVPDYDLDLMSSEQTLTDITSLILKNLQNVYEEFYPDLLIVHGDTNTTFAASLSAFYNKIKVAHIEAGLRTNDILNPFPEEANRQLTSKIADYHFAPTENSRQNLLKEDIDSNRIINTGNTVIDSIFWALRKIKNNNELKNNITNKFKFYDKSKKIILITCHRRENFGNGIKDLCEAINSLSSSIDNIHIVFPIHLNPNIKKATKKYLKTSSNIFIYEPLDYLSFSYLMSISYIILTDSGGIQEEALALKKPVLLMRDSTERPEAIKSGTVKIVGTSPKAITENIRILIDDREKYEEMQNAKNPFGNGKACEKITSFLIKNL